MNAKKSCKEDTKNSDQTTAIETTDDNCDANKLTSDNTNEEIMILNGQEKKETDDISTTNQNFISKEMNVAT